MKITIGDVEYIQGKSGIGMRCTLNVGAQHPVFGAVQQTTKGCLVFRDRKGRINFLPPLMYVGAAKTRYRHITLSPGLAKWLEGEMERKYGQFIKRTDRAASAGMDASHYGLPTEFELGEV